MRNRYVVLAFAVLLGAQCAVLLGQTGRATITGIVRDSTSAVVPNVTVTAVNVQTQVKYPGATNEVGNYTIASLPVGEYSVTFTSAGFRELTRGGLALSSGQVARFDVLLEVGQVVEKLTVTGEAPLLQTETAQASKSVDTSIFNGLPLSFSGGRNMADFADKLIPGVNGSWWNMRIQGTPAASQSIIIDGMNSLSMLPGDFAENSISPEAIQEMTVFTGNQSAEFGRAAGGSLNFVLKSGTNQFHGSGFYYLRNEILNANDWNNNRLLAADPNFASPQTESFKRPKQRRFDRGFSAGGPVFIPKIYDGKDRTFVYFSYERFTNKNQGPSPLSKAVPQPEMWDGNLSRLLKGNVGTDVLGRPVTEGQIYDPSSLREVNGQFVADPFLGNIIPPARISKVAAGFKPIFAKYYPPVTTDLTNNLYFTNFLDQKLVQTTIKVDHSFSPKHKVSGFYFWNGFPRMYQNAGGLWSLLDPTLGGPLAKGSLQDNRGDSWNVNHDWMISASLLNHASFGINAKENKQYSRQLGRGYEKAWGVLGVGAGFPADKITAPAFNLGSSPVASFESWGDGENLNRLFWGYAADNTLSWQRRSHSFKFGVSFVRLRAEYANYGNTGGSFSFASRTTGIPGQSYTSRIGNSFASFLLGEVDSASMFVNFNPASHRDHLALFVQDSWKVTSTLTLNYGLRWSGNTPIYEDQDRMAAFNPKLADPNANGRLGAVEYMGSGAGRSGRRSAANSDWRDFGPTFGFAWRLRNRMVARGGYGITFTPESIATSAGWSAPIPGNFAAGFSPLNSVPANSKGIYRPVFNIDGGYQGSETPPNLDPSWGQKRGSVLVSPDYAKAGYVQSFSLGLQTEVSRNTIVELDWRASKGTRIHAGGNVIPNQIRKEELYRGAVLGQVIDTPAKAAAAGLVYPYAGWSGLGANTLMPYPQINTQGLSAWEDPVGFSTYHSANLIVTRRMSGGLAAYGAYTFAKTISNVSDVMGTGAATGLQDAYDRRLYKSIDPTDRTHVIKSTFTWDLPFGKGRAMLGNAPGVLRAVVGGWSVAAILNYRSGTPIGSPSSRTTPVGWNGSTVRSNFATPSGGFVRVFDPEKFNPWNASDPNNRFFDPKAFSDALPQQLGNAPMRFPQVRTLWAYSEDASLLKRFSIKERVRVEFRVELLNAFNRHFFGSPDTNMNNAYFGNIRTASGGRSGQFGMRVDW